jgi:hypothetical protein
MKILYKIIVGILIIINLIFLYFYLDGKYIDVGVKTVSNVDFRNLLLLDFFLLIILFLIRKKI